MLCAKLFTDYLDSKNYRYSSRVDSDGDTVVDFPNEGKVAKCFFSGENGHYLSMYLVYEKIPENRYADLVFMCNELNIKYKWVTFYVDKDRDLMMHLDAILTPENAADEAFELLLRVFNILSKTKPDVMKAIYS